MSGFLLDTAIIIDYLRGRREAVELVRGVFSEGSLLGCCPINIIEVYAGMREGEREATRELLDSLEYHELTKPIAEWAGECKLSYQKKGFTLSLPDVAIAAIAIANDLVLMTDNPKHYPMPELELRVLSA